MTKRKPRRWNSRAIERAERALAANKAAIESAASTGIASEKTLRQRDYRVSPRE